MASSWRNKSNEAIGRNRTCSSELVSPTQIFLAGSRHRGRRGAGLQGGFPPLDRGGPPCAVTRAVLQSELWLHGSATRWRCSALRQSFLPLPRPRHPQRLMGRSRPSVVQAVPFESPGPSSSSPAPDADAGPNSPRLAILGPGVCGWSRSRDSGSEEGEGKRNNKGKERKEK